MPSDPKEREDEHRDSISHFEHSLQEALEDSVRDITDMNDKNSAQEDDK
jgi:hypothetical protein